jgi:hypothetical protein
VKTIWYRNCLLPLAIVQPTHSSDYATSGRLPGTLHKGWSSLISEVKELYYETNANFVFFHLLGAGYVLIKYLIFAWFNSFLKEAYRRLYLPLIFVQKNFSSFGISATTQAKVALSPAWIPSVHYNLVLKYFLSIYHIPCCVLKKSQPWIYTIKYAKCAFTSTS